MNMLLVYLFKRLAVPLNIFMLFIISIVLDYTYIL